MRDPSLCTRRNSHSSSGEVSILVVDDHPVFRRGLIDLLRMAWPTASFSEAGSLSEARSLLKALDWDAVLLDLALGDGSGIDLLEPRQRLPPVLVLTLHQEPFMASLARSRGARGLVSKSSPPEQILTALRTLLAGDEFWPSSSDPRNPAALRLSGREKEILRHLLGGMGPKEIADRLGVSHSSVQSYKGRLFDKLGVETIQDLIRIASMLPPM